VVLNFHQLQLTLDRCECNLKATVWLEECSLRASQSISGVSVADLLSFIQNLMQTRGSILPSIAAKGKQSQKNTRVKTVGVHSVVSHGILMQ
jgi:hypothetical protein